LTFSDIMERLQAEIEEGTKLTCRPLSKNAPAAFLRARFLGTRHILTPIDDQMASIEGDRAVQKVLANRKS
jgi:hypothetical protein